MYDTSSAKVTTHRRLVNKCVVFMVKVLYQKQQHANDFLAFVLKILIAKLSLVLVGQLPKNMIKFWKKLNRTGKLAVVT